MTAAAFLKLQRSGFTEPQVEALAEYLDTQAATRADLLELRADLSAELGEVKAGLAALRADTQREVGELKAELRNGLRDLEQRMTIRLGGMMVAAVALVAALVRLL